jgi:hypothetical protein
MKYGFVFRNPAICSNGLNAPIATADETAVGIAVNPGILI